jgi:hypothetical protein
LTVPTYPLSPTPKCTFFCCRVPLGRIQVKFSFYDSTPKPFAPTQNLVAAPAGFELDDVSITLLLPGQNSNFTNPSVLTSSIPEPTTGVLVAVVLGMASLVGLFRKKLA